MNRKKQLYQQEVVPALMTKYNKPNPFAVAKLAKITINVGVGNEANRQQSADAVMAQLAEITGQRPHITPARMSIASFKVRQGDPVGVAVTLRGERMWNFFDKVVSIALPQVKDFSGVSRTAFDQVGNYSLGLTEQIIFPEIVYDEIDRVRGMQIVMTIRNANGPAESFDLLEKLGMPFSKEE
jgi:large subunit ribosomal protein L5